MSIVPYRNLPGGVRPRPFLDVLIGDADHRVSGLVDSGSLHGLFNTEVAAEAGIVLANADERAVELGPQRFERTTLFTIVPMEFDGHQWEAEVGFGDWVSLDWGLLGHDALFRWFTITFFAADAEFEILPIAE